MYAVSQGHGAGAVAVTMAVSRRCIGGYTCRGYGGLFGQASCYVGNL